MYLANFRTNNVTLDEVWLDLNNNNSTLAQTLIKNCTRPDPAKNRDCWKIVCHSNGTSTVENLLNNFVPTPTACCVLKKGEGGLAAVADTATLCTKSRSFVCQSSK